MKGAGGHCACHMYGREPHAVCLLASKLGAGSLNYYLLESSKKDLCGGGVLLLALNGLSQILRGHPWLLTKFPVFS